MLLHRNRQDYELPAFTFLFEKSKIKLVFPKNWLAKAPLTRADLKDEANYLKEIGLKLEFK